MPTAPRALVITGAGDKAFVSGGDLKELSALRTEAEASAMAWRMRTICDRIAGFPGPMIAALNGHALGGGAEVAVAADIRLAADDIKIGFNQVTLEIMPAWGGAERLAELVGRSQALLLAGTGSVLGRRRGRARRPDRPGAAAGLVRRRLAHHREGTRDPARRRDQARDRRRQHHRSRRRVRPAVGLRRALGRRRPGDEARQVSPASRRGRFRIGSLPSQSAAASCMKIALTAVASVSSEISMTGGGPSGGST